MKKKLVCLFFFCCVFLFAQAGAASAPNTVSILFTHDMHSHLSASMAADGTSVGGFAKLKTAIDHKREEYPSSLVLDAGDFSMGTPFQTIFMTDASELRMMGQLGYDATTLGNHEFDYKAKGLSKMLDAAAQSGDALPLMLIANIDWEASLEDADNAVLAKELLASMERYGYARFSYLTRDGLTIAVFGLMGREADSYAPESGLVFTDFIKSAKQVVSLIQAEGKADMIVCLSHSGTNPDPEKSEDELLAKAVPEIDVIVSAHTHTTLEEPIVCGDTIIVSAGSYTEALGHLVVEQNNGRWSVSSYELIPLDRKVAEDEETLHRIDAFQEKITQHYFSQFGYAYDQIIARTEFLLAPSKEQGDNGLGSLIADSYVYAIKKAEGDDYIPVDVSVCPLGVIRASFVPGDITVADAFNVSSLGIGPDGVPGYPVVTLYLTGKEIKTVAEIDISVSELMAEARLYMYGLRYTYNPSRLLLNRVTGVSLLTPTGTEELEDDTLYRVAGGLYSCQMLSAVEGKSFGLLKVTPKDANGVAITDFEEHIVYDKNVELKEWAALATYLSSFEQKDGVPTVPAQYQQLQARKVQEASSSLVDLLKQPNHIFWIVVAACLFVLALIACIVAVTVCLVKKKRAKRA